MKARHKYIVDIGDCYTLIYFDGLIFKQPTAALVKKESELLLVSVGDKAVLHPKENQLSLINPVNDGSVISPVVAGLMLRDFLDEAIKKRLFQHVEIVAPISAALTLAERESFESIFARAGCPNVRLVESIMGLLPYVHKDGQLVLEFRDGTAEVGVISNEGIITACSVNLGAKKLNRMLKEHIIYAQGVELSDAGIERLKGEISLYEGDNSVCRHSGADILDGNKKMVEITSKSVRPVLEKAIKTLADIIQSILTTVPIGICDDIRERGLFLAGSLAEINGLCEYMQKILGMPIIVDTKDAETTVLRGFFNQ